MTTKTTKSAASGKIQLKWVRSMICTPVKHKKVVKGLGFTRLNQVIERPDTAAIRGMVKKIPHLVEIVEVKYWLAALRGALRIFLRADS
jgi:large subunit ribosomal protein L30